MVEDLKDEIEYIEKYTSNTLSYVQIKMGYTLTLTHDFASKSQLYITKDDSLNKFQYLKLFPGLDKCTAIIPFTTLKKMYTDSSREYKHIMHKKPIIQKKIDMLVKLLEYVFAFEIQISV